MNKQETLRSLVADLGTAEVKHKQVEEELKRRVTLAALTHEVAQRMSGVLRPKELFFTIVTAVNDVLDYRSVALFLVDEDVEYLSLQAVAGRRADAFHENFRVAVGRGMIGHAAATGEPQVSGDVSQDAHCVREAGDETESELAVPIKNGQKVIGVLDLQSDAFDAFDEVEVDAMKTLSTHIATAIENARLFKETQDRAKRLGVVNRKTDIVDAGEVAAGFSHGINDGSGVVHVSYLGRDGVVHAVTDGYLLLFIIVPSGYLIDVEILGLDVFFVNAFILQGFHDFVHGRFSFILGYGDRSFLRLDAHADRSYIGNSRYFALAVYPDSLLLAIKVAFKL